MTQPRPEQDPAKGDTQIGAHKRISPREEQAPRAPVIEKEDQADSGPDRDHPITTGNVK
jgi:hypothetical protein